MSGQAHFIIPRRLASLLLQTPSDCADAPCCVPVPAGLSIREACEHLQLRLPAAILPLVNGVTQDLSYILQPEDEVYLVIQLSGGCPHGSLRTD